tara:strand:- start:385 stop:1263 length:879 start_codon:yes stop_codon:yes gene_type:complete
MKYTIEHENTLLGVLELMMPSTSKSKLRKMLTEGRIQVNGEVIHKAKYNVSSKSLVEILERKKALANTPPPKSRKNSKLNVVWEDEAILVVEKPAGLLSIATDKLEKDTLHSWCVDYVREENEKNWCFIVHRLDRDTSGVMVFARHERHKEYLQSQFSRRSVHRTYHALVEGRPRENHGTSREWLVEDKHLHVKKVKSSFHGAKEAITHWNIEQTTNVLSLLHITIETGRRHQIRMAMKTLGCPVVGDGLHGAESNPLQRICLHASSLEFLHPLDDEPVRFEAPIPNGFQLL